jgi:hypothetical protein
MAWWWLLETKPGCLYMYCYCYSRRRRRRRRRATDDVNHKGSSEMYLCSIHTEQYIVKW